MTKLLTDIQIAPDGGFKVLDPGLEGGQAYNADLVLTNFLSTA